MSRSEPGSSCSCWYCSCRRRCRFSSSCSASPHSSRPSSGCSSPFIFLFTAFYGFCVSVPKRADLLGLKTWKELSDAAKVLCLDSRQDSITLRRQIEAFITRNEGAKFVWVAPESMIRFLRKARLMKVDAGAMEGGPKPKDRGGAVTKAHERPRKGPHGEVVTPEPGRIARTKSEP